MVKVGDKVKAVGMGKAFIELVHGATGEGEVIHVGYGDGTVETSDFPEKEAYKIAFPSQYEKGVFFRDTGTDQALYLLIEDTEIVEAGNTELQ